MWIRETGGGERDRTDDLLLAKQALSQLSYTPRSGSGFQAPGLSPIRAPLRGALTVPRNLYPVP